MAVILFGSMLLFFPIFSQAANQDIVINEIGAFEAADYEWIEIFNRGSAAVDLTGWKFYENETNHGLAAFRGDLIIEPQEYAIIANKADKFAERYASFSGTIIDSSWSNLNESGEAIAIKAGDGTVIELFTYISAPNRSLERANYSLADYTSLNWQEHTSGNTAGSQNSNYSSSSSGSQNQQNTEQQETNQTSPVSSQNQPPVVKAGQDVVANIGTEIIFDGAQSYDPEGQGISYLWNFGNGAVSKEAKIKYKYDYSGTYLVTLTVSDGLLSVSDQIRVVIYPLGIVINEFLPNPKGADKDNEWIELKNLSDSSVDLSGWQIANQDEKIKAFTIPEQTFILPGGLFILDKKNMKITFANKEGSVKLLYPNGEIVEEVKYEISAKDGYSAARKSDGSFVWTKNPSPGINNILISDAILDKISAKRSEKIVQEKINSTLNIVTPLKYAVKKQAGKSAIDYLIKSVEAKTVSGVDGEIVGSEEDTEIFSKDEKSFSKRILTARADLITDLIKNPFQIFNLVALIILIFIFARLRLKK